MTSTSSLVRSAVVTCCCIAVCRSPSREAVRPSCSPTPSHASPCSSRSPSSSPFSESSPPTDRTISSTVPAASPVRPAIACATRSASPAASCASSRTCSATTANVAPCSPARAASMRAFSDSSFVWSAIRLIASTNAFIRSSDCESCATRSAEARISPPTSSIRSSRVLVASSLACLEAPMPARDCSISCASPATARLASSQAPRMSPAEVCASSQRSAISSAYGAIAAVTASAAC